MKILVIEDNPDHFEIISGLCYEISTNLDVEHALTLAHGLDVLYKGEHDLAFCDLNLSDSDFEQTVAALKTLDVDTPIVVLTSHDDLEVAKKLVESGIQDYLPKLNLEAGQLRRVAIYAIERKKQQRALENKTRDQEAFCRSLTHDFKSPVRNIGQLSRFLRESLSTQMPLADSDVEMFDLIDQKVGSINQLIDGLYQYLKVDIAADNTEKLDLKDLVDEVITFIDSEKNGRVQFVVNDLPVIEGVRAQLFLMFQNIIANGIKYNEHDPEIRIWSVNGINSQYCTISISDNGIGMKDEDLQKIFEPFRRLHGAEKYAGTGLGLSIVKRVIDNHGGKVALTSTPGVGTTFTLSLPLSQASQWI